MDGAAAEEVARGGRDKRQAVEGHARGEVTGQGGAVGPSVGAAQGGHVGGGWLLLQCAGLYAPVAAGTGAAGGSAASAPQGHDAPAAQESAMARKRVDRHRPQAKHRSRPGLGFPSEAPRPSPNPGSREMTLYICPHKKPVRKLDVWSFEHACARIPNTDD